MNLGEFASLLSAERVVSAEELSRAGAILDGETIQAFVEVRSLVERLRLRDRQLSALVAGARELAAVQDVQHLLQKLVDRAHELMRTDITYLSEYDSTTDELFVRTHRGAVSARLRGLRVPAGVGLASRIVQARTALWTANYDDESEFPRDTEVDKAIDAERMRSILGTPLIADDQVLGVLFAADRSSHGFDADQIATFNTFADHAAVVLKTAQLLARERAATRAATMATDEVHRRAEEMEASAAVHEELTRLVLRGENSQALASTLAKSLNRPVAVADRDLRVLHDDGGFTPKWWPYGEPSTGTLQAIELSRTTGRWASLSDDDQTGVAAAVAGPRLLGVLVVASRRDDPLLTAVQRRTVERAAQILALLIMQRDAVVDAESRFHGELVNDLMTGRINTSSLQRWAKDRGIDINREWRAVACAIGDQRRWNPPGRLLSSDTRWLVGVHGQSLVVLVPEADIFDPLDLARAVQMTTGDHNAVAVVANSLSALTDIGRHAVEAATTAQLIVSLGLRGGTATTSQFSPYLAMFGTDGERANSFAQVTLEPVIDWDEAHGTALMGTLEAFLLEGGSLPALAKRLHIHTNTLKQRLERLDTLLGRSWREGEQRFRLEVAVQIRTIRRYMS